MVQFREFPIEVYRLPFVENKYCRLCSSLGSYAPWSILTLRKIFEIFQENGAVPERKLWCAY
jgi:hypothetical protein